MTKSIRINRAVAGAGVLLALMLGVASGASAQCVGTYHSSSGSGSAHSASGASGVHAASSATHSASTSSCATHGTTAKSAALRPAGFGAERMGAGTSHRTASHTAGAIRNASEKKVGAKS